MAISGPESVPEISQFKALKTAASLTFRPTGFSAGFAGGGDPACRDFDDHRIATDLDKQRRVGDRKSVV